MNNRTKTEVISKEECVTSEDRELLHRLVHQLEGANEQELRIIYIAVREILRR